MPSRRKHGFERIGERRQRRGPRRGARLMRAGDLDGRELFHIENTIPQADAFIARPEGPVNEWTCHIWPIPCSIYKTSFQIQTVMLYSGKHHEDQGEEAYAWILPACSEPTSAGISTRSGIGMLFRPTKAIPSSSALPAGAFSCSLIFQEPGRKASVHHHKIEELFFVHAGRLTMTWQFGDET